MNDWNRLEAEDTERRDRLSMPDALRSAATWYAGVGWPIFPLRPGGKTPLTSNGFKAATTDAGQIAAWWTATPAANIGAPTGINFDCIDVDGPEGFASLANIWHHMCPADCCATTTCSPDRTEILGLPVLAVAYTGGGGRHILVAPTGDRNGAKIVPGIDYRGEGGYIVLAPSRHETGRLYQWLQPPDHRLTGKNAA